MFPAPLAIPTHPHCYKWYILTLLIFYPDRSNCKIRISMSCCIQAIHGENEVRQPVHLHDPTSSLSGAVTAIQKTSHLLYIKLLSEQLLRKLPHPFRVVWITRVGHWLSDLAFFQVCPRELCFILVVLRLDTSWVMGKQTSDGGIEAGDHMRCCPLLGTADAVLVPRPECLNLFFGDMTS